MRCLQQALAHASILVAQLGQSPEDTAAFPVGDPKGKGVASPDNSAPLQRVDGFTGGRARYPGELLTFTGSKAPLPQGPLRYPQASPPKDGKENIDPIDSGGSSGKRKGSPDKGPAVLRAIQDAPDSIDAPWPKMQMLHALQFTPGACSWGVIEGGLQMGPTEVISCR